MRFGRRGRGRSREPIWARREGAKSSGEPSVEIPTDGSAAPAMELISEESDTATQEILTHLGRFSREWSKPDNALWSDASMNQLILCIEIAIEEGWSDLTMVLSDTGRVLQTYENAERPAGAIPFLEKAYDVMCRLVGDIVIEKAPPETLEEWSRVYSEGVAVLERDGLELFQDDEGDGNIEEPADEALEGEIPFHEAGEELVSRVAATAPGDRDKLPVLDELPPLESLVTIYTEPEPEPEPDREPEPVYVSDEGVAEEAVEEEITAEEAEEAVETEAPVVVEELNFAAFEMPRVEVTEPDSEVVSEAVPVAEEPDDRIAEEASPAPVEDDRCEIEVYDPPRMVVDIIDRICEVLGDFESDASEDRSAGLDVLLGGLKALEREAHLMENGSGERACAAMMEVCLLVHRHEGCWSERFLELGFAFCGIFIEALTEPDGENVVAWQKECEDWLTENAATDSEPKKDSGAVPAFAPEVSDAETIAVDSDAASAVEACEDGDDSPEISTDDRTDGDGLSLFSSVNEEEVVTAEVDEEPDTQPGDSGDPERDAAESESVEDVNHAERSQSLLRSAQEAALQGKSEDAKTFALRAAAEIAKSEVQKAEASLRESEMKLKEGIINIEEARSGVKSCEDSVLASAALVADSQKTLTEAQEARGRAAKTLEDLESDVAELNRQIQELQAKRDEEVECISQRMGEMESMRATEQQASNELEELRRLEEDGRSRLEETRQIVKDKQRVIQVIESEMERARETLMKEKVSYADITQAIQQISGTSIQDGEGSEGLLF